MAVVSIGPATNSEEKPVGMFLGWKNNEPQEYHDTAVLKNGDVDGQLIGTVAIGADKRFSC